MRLLVDLGNTRLKCALADGGAYGPVQAFAHGSKVWRAQLDAWLAPQRADIETVWLASVAAADRTDEVLAFFAHLGLRVHRVQSQAEALGLIAGYPHVRQLGEDRWLALLAAHLHHPVPCLVVGVGSALTIDALAPGGRHLGGLIAPSPEGMREALFARAPALDRRHAGVVDFATDTASGVASGCTLAAVALIERSLARLQACQSEPVTLLVSGGGADGEFRGHLGPHRHLPGLVLEGLAAWADAQRGTTSGQGA